MPFKFHSFLPDDEDELCRARPGSPPAFFSLPSPVSPRVCGNCIPGLSARAVAAAVTAAAAQRSSTPVRPSRERLPERQVRAEAAVEVKDKKCVRTEGSNRHGEDKQAALFLNLFRYTLGLKKEEEKQQTLITNRAHARAIRAAVLYQIAVGGQPNDSYHLEERQGQILITWRGRPSPMELLKMIELFNET